MTQMISKTQAPVKRAGRIDPIAFFERFGVLIFMILLLIFFQSQNSNFFSERNIFNILTEVSIYGIMAVGMTFVILTAGIDLSVGSILAVCAMTAAYVIKGDNFTTVDPNAWGGMSWLIGLGICLAMGTAIGFLHGLGVTRLRLPPFIVTLGTYTALRGAAYLLADGTTVINSNINFEWIGNNYLGPIPWLVVIALAVIVVCWFILRRTTLGVHIYAVGGNMQAARLTGIKVWLVLLFVYGMSGLLSGLGGVMSASRLYSANGNLGTGYELDAIAAVILGGTSFVGGIGTITGTLVGALIIATLNNGMTLMGVSYFWQLVIKGAVIIIAVLIDKYRTRHHQSA